MDKIKTSVIIPVYNTAQYLDECLQSVLRQSQIDLEVIIIDDGSTDNSEEVLSSYEKTDARVSVFKQENMKQGAARNNGLKHAIGEYIYYLDSDDSIDLDAMETCYYYAQKYDLDIVLFDARSFIEGVMFDDFIPDSFDRREVIKDRDRIYTGREFLNLYMYTNPDTVSPCLMYTSKKIIDKYNLSFCEGVCYEDEEYRFKIMLLAEKVMYIPRLMYNRRYRPGSTMTTEYTEEKLYNRIVVIEQMLDDVQKYSYQEVNFELERQYIGMRVGGLLAECRHITDVKIKSLISFQVRKLMIDFFEKLKFEEDNINDMLFFYGQYRNILDVFGKEESITKEFNSIYEKGKKILKKILEKLPLQDENVIIGIYGTGIHTKILLNEYCSLVGGIKAKIVYIDSNKESDKYIYNYSSVYNIRDIKDLQLDAIIISSRLYEDEIINQIQNLYGDKYKIYRFYDVYKKIFF